jgi:peptidoglycan/LPS O-acetylase OafA/YrhL
VQSTNDARPTGTQPRPAQGSAADAGPRRPRIVGLDLFRVLVVAFVVAVHTLSYGAPTSGPVGAFLTVFHTSRELFFLLTAFVLTYNYGQRPRIRWLSFWRKRYALVVPAYVVWSLIYFLFDGTKLDPVSGAVLHFGHDLMNGSARFHLYFLLVTMQVYLAFPVLRWLLRKTARHHLVLLAVAFGYQVVLTVAIQQHLITTGILGSCLNKPSAWLFSYLFYVVAGGVAAWHFDQLAAFTRRHAALAWPVFAAGLCVGLGAYFAGIEVAGQSPATAATVFQPAILAESVCFGWALLAVSLRWADRGARHRRLVSAGADCSFGIFLAHPLVLQGLIWAGNATGARPALRSAPVTLQLVVLLGAVVPFIYALAWTLAALARRTPLSLPLTGRRRARPARRIRPEPVTATE